MKRKTSETKRKVTSRAASLPKQLTTLESADLVRLAQRKPALEYLFRHALIQDAAYQSLLKADRRTLHQLVGETLEQLYPKRLGELAPLLAQHFVAAGDDERALKYFTQAGDEAMRVYANAEAILHYTHALNLAKAASFAVEPSQGSTLQHLYMQCGRALELSGRYAEALQNYVEMETLAQARSDGALELAAVMARGTIYATATTKFDAPQAQALCERALQLARSLGDAAAEAKILWNVSNLHGFSGDPAQAILYGEQAVAVARAHGLREQMAFALHDIWRDYLVTGQLARGHEAVREVSALWRELDNRPMLTDSLATASGLYFYDGQYAECERCSHEALQLSETINNDWGRSYSRFFVGNVYWHWGEPTRAMEAMEACIQLGEQAGFAAPLSQTRCELALVYAQLGAYDRALDLAQQALRAAEQVLPVFIGATGAALARVHLHRSELAAAEQVLAQVRPRANLAYPLSSLPMFHAECEYALAQRDYARSLAQAQRFLDALRQCAWKPYVPSALYLRGCALRGLQRYDEAHAAFSEARTLAETLGARQLLWRIDAALSDLETQRGNLTEAQALRQQAREVIAYIAEHCPPELRESFLNLPEVRSVHRET